MRLGAVALAAGLFGGLGTLCFLLAFGTDYWLVASDGCGGYGPVVLEGEPGENHQTTNTTVEVGESGRSYGVCTHTHVHTHTHASRKWITVIKFHLLVHETASKSD